MTYTVTKLITNAYYISNIVSRDFGTVSGTQLNDGLDSLNDILGEKTVDDGMIPYVTRTTFPGVIGQETYFITDLIDVDTLTFISDTVRYQMWDLSRTDYFGTARANNITSLPYTFNLERTFGGANINIYFLPDQAYTFEYVGTMRLSSVTNNQDLELTLDRFYISYLKYALAERICSDYGIQLPANVGKTLQQMINQINNRSAPIDTTMVKLSTLGASDTMNYAQYNIGKGWTAA